jgi:hypothetical protein
MAHDPKSAGTAPPGSIEFEVTDLDTARRALEDLPQVFERALSSETIRWLLSLPAPLRPHALCKRYPRVGNTIAQAWPKADTRVSVLAGLVVDHRGRRAGFPPEVRKEIEALLRALSPSARATRQ